METQFGTNDPQTVKLWSKLTFYEAIFMTYMGRFMGTSNRSILQRVPDLERNAGDTIKYDLLVQLAGYGVDGDSELSGNEEELTYHQAEVYIDQKRHGEKCRRMSQQRTVHNLRNDARLMLADWFARIYDEFWFAYMAGFGGVDSAGNPTALANALPFAGNALLTSDSSTEQRLIDQTGATMSIKFIDYALELAKTASPLIRPAMVGGEPKFVLILHPYSVTELRTSASSGEWLDIQKNAGVRGGRNPIYTGALGEYNGVIIHESTRVPYDANNGYAYNLFLGAQAGVFAYGNAYSRLDQEGPMGRGNMFSWFEETGDHGNKKAVSAGSIFGMQKNRFNGTDHGVIQIRTADAAHF